MINTMVTVRLWKKTANGWERSAFAFPLDPSNLTCRANAYLLKEGWQAFKEGDHPEVSKPVSNIPEEIKKLKNPYASFDPDLAYQGIKEDVEKGRKQFVGMSSFFEDQYRKIQKENQKNLKPVATQKLKIATLKKLPLKRESTTGKLVEKLSSEQGATMKEIRTLVGIITFQEGDLKQRLAMFGYEYEKRGDKYILLDNPLWVD